MGGPEAAGGDGLRAELMDLLARRQRRNDEPAQFDLARCIDAQWRAVEVMARRSGLSCSGLALAAGLEKGSLNRTKRNGPRAKPGPRALRFGALTQLCEGAGVTLVWFAEIYEEELRRCA